MSSRIRSDRSTGRGLHRAAALLAVAALGPAAPARADDPNVLERVVSVKRAPGETSARLIDTPVLQILRAQEGTVAGGHREDLKVVSSPLFALFDRESSTEAAGAATRSQSEGRFVSLLGVSLLEWSSERERGIDGGDRAAETEWRFLDVPVLGPLFARSKSEEGSEYRALFFLRFGSR
jgi:hypothetical protein